MFTFTCVFDSLLFRPPDDEVCLKYPKRMRSVSVNWWSFNYFPIISPQDIGSYQEVQTVLREEIVNPLRKNLFVRADRVMKLRELLEKLSSVTGLTCEEKDPEEFLNSLLTQIMRAEPFLKVCTFASTCGNLSHWPNNSHCDVCVSFDAVELRPRCILLPTIRWERRTAVIPHGAATVRAELHGIRH